VNTVTMSAGGIASMVRCINATAASAVSSEPVTVADDDQVRVSCA
jgi:hypothetical protein